MAWRTFVLPATILPPMDEDKIQDVIARAKKLSAERRKEIATKASKAAAAKRTKEANKKKH